MTTERFAMTLLNAPPGILLTLDGILVFKTEYHRDGGRPDLYVALSGERYCGSESAMCVEVSALCDDAAKDYWRIE